MAKKTATAQLNRYLKGYMNTVDKVNDLALESLRPGPAAFLHRYLWEKIHAIHISHSNRGLFGAEMAVAPNMIIDEIYAYATVNNPLHLTPSSPRPRHEPNGRK